MFDRLTTLCYAAVIALVAALSFGALTPGGAAPPQVASDGIVRVKSAYGFEETVSRLRTAAEVIASITSSVAAR